MREGTVSCTVGLAGHESLGSGDLVLKLRVEPKSEGRGCVPTTVAVRAARAARWALDIDSQYVELIDSGHSPQVSVPAAPTAARGRVVRETAEDYRNLRLGTGEMIRPVLLDPPELRELFPYQRKGVEWLLERRGGILADDMGLGKTVQAISAIRILFNRAEVRAAVVVCPKGMLGTWMREFARWAPELGVVTLTPPARLREEAWRVVTGRCHVLLTNYEQLRNPPAILARSLQT